MSSSKKLLPELCGRPHSSTCGGDAKLKYTHQHVDDCGYLQGIPEIFQQYFDYEAFSRDLFLSDLDEEEGHIL